MNYAPSLIIGGRVLSLEARLQAFSQQYEPLTARSILRSANGSAHIQQRWSRLKTTLSGSGWVPAGLADLPTAEPLELHCAAARMLQAAGPQIGLPAFRTDIPPVGYALRQGHRVPVQMNVQNGIALLTPLAGADAYEVAFWPILNVFAEYHDSGDIRNSSYSWSLSCEEI